MIRLRERAWHWIALTLAAQAGVDVSGGPRIQPATRLGWQRRPDLDRLHHYAWETPDGTIHYAHYDVPPQVIDARKH
jgi:hypothetical protein